MSTLDAFVSKLIPAVTGSVDKAKANVANALEREIISTLDRVSNLKNLIYRERSAKLRDIFVAPELMCGTKLHTADDVFNKFINGSRIIVSGSAGLGKSVLLKHYSLLHVEEDLRIIPLFIELRKIDEASTRNLLKAIKKIYGIPEGADSSSFDQSLMAGKFSILLDGFDEVHASKKSDIEAAIIEFCYAHPSCPIMVSGRNDESFYSWDQFTVFQIKPMSIERTIALIEKIEYDEGLKKKFIEEAVPELFKERDKSFVQTPLLAILMLLTYELYAEVPKKMHIFYERAFDILLIGHDVTKSQFRRELSSGLSEEDFRSVFSCFCALSYSDREYEFSRTKVLSYISHSLKACSVQAAKDKVLHDLLSSVCVMQYEGLEYSFVHRSFQEYFTAVYLKACPTDTIVSFFERGYHPSRENVLPMLIDMDRNRLEPEWVLPVLEKIKEFIDFEDEEDRVRGLLVNYYEQFGFSRIGTSVNSITHPGKEKYQRLYAVEKMYPQKGADSWWFDGWDKASVRASRLIGAYKRGVIDPDYVTVIEPDEDNPRARYGSTDYIFDLAGINPDLYKRLGLWSYSLKIINHIDRTYKEVKGRVEERNSFRGKLFSQESLVNDFDEN